MKRLLAAACLLGMLTAGCATENQPSGAVLVSPNVVASSVEAIESPVADQGAVDAVLDHFITGTLMLTQMQAGSLQQEIAQYEGAQREWADAASALRSGIPGIPAETSDAVLAALDRTQTSMTAFVACVRASTTTDCDDETTTASEHSNALGAEIAALIPYGSRSNNEILSALEGGDDAVGAGTEPESVSQSNAREKAASYLEYAAFSRQGLIQQLEYEGFSTADATYGADAVGADWNEQAALKAQSYLDYSAFSRSGLIEQLEYEGFTHAQATYGADAVRL